jgi:hypothetical protein
MNKSVLALAGFGFAAGIVLNKCGSRFELRYEPIPTRGGFVERGWG